MTNDKTQEAGEEEASSSNVPELPTEAYGVPTTFERSQQVLHTTVENYFQTVEALKADGFISAIDLCGVDNLTRNDLRLPQGHKGERFEVVINLISHSPARRIRLRVQIPEQNPTVPTLYDLYPGTENMEREAYDLFGIVFENHPDMTRILMPADWEGYPLRKDYAVGSVPVQFKGLGSK